MPNAAQRLDAPFQDEKAKAKAFVVIQTQNIEHLELELVRYDQLGFEPVEVIPLGPRSHQLVFRRKDLNPAIRIALEIRKLRDAVAAAAGSGKAGIFEAITNNEMDIETKKADKPKAQSKRG